MAPQSVLMTCSMLPALKCFYILGSWEAVQNAHGRLSATTKHPASVTKRPRTNWEVLRLGSEECFCFVIEVGRPTALSGWVDHSLQLPAADVPGQTTILSLQPHGLFRGFQMLPTLARF